MAAIGSRDAALKATEQPIDASTAAGKCLLDALGMFARFATMTACRSLDFQIEFAHQRAPRRFLTVDVGGIVLRRAREWHGSLGREPLPHVIR
jgi:hypothetical protein